MGCDIHMFCEVRNQEGKWIFQKDKFKNRYYRSESPINDWNTEKTDEPYQRRSYDLFAILADVRNGYGFAGIITGAGFIPISEPKGVPQDASQEYLDIVEGWGGDGHSHSYFTISEIEAFDWNQVTIKKGVLTIAEYKKCRDEETAPTSWCGDVSGENIITVNATAADSIIANTKKVKDKEVYVEYHWPIKYSDHAKSFLEDTIPQLKELGNPDEVRIVFLFDN